MTRNKKIIVSLIVLFLAASGFIGYRVFATNQKEDKQYSLYEVKKSEDLYFSGKIVSKNKQTVTYDNLLGEISAINVANGAQVNAGDVLVTYTSKDNQNTLTEKRAVQAQYTQNIADLNVDLNEQNNKLAKAKRNYDETAKQAAESEIKALNTSITNYQDMLADINAQIATLENTAETVITAETNGVVTVDETAKNNNTLPVVTVNSNEVIAEISVSEYDIEKIAVEQPVTLNYMNQDKQVAGKISYKGLTPVDPSSSSTSYPVHLTLDEAIPLGYSVKVAIPQEERKIPASAVQTDGEDQYVFIYSNGKAIKKQIKATKISEDNYKLEEGLEEGEKIIRNPKGVKDQMEVNAS